MTPPQPEPITAVVFDLGGVLVQWRAEVILARAFDDPAARAAVRASLFDSQDWVELDRGTLSEAEALDRTAARTGQPMTALTRLMGIVRESLEALPDTVALLADLHQRGVPLYCLSNMHHRSIAFLRGRYPFLAWFRGMVISAEVNMVKPEPGIYRHLLTQYHLEGPRTVFIDDYPANCRGAEAVGLRSLCFTTAADCRRQLEAMLAT